MDVSDAPRCCCCCCFLGQRKRGEEICIFGQQLLFLVSKILMAMLLCLMRHGTHGGNWPKSQQQNERWQHTAKFGVNLSHSFLFASRVIWFFRPISTRHFDEGQCQKSKTASNLQTKACHKADPTHCTVCAGSATVAQTTTRQSMHNQYDFPNHHHVDCQ